MNIKACIKNNYKTVVKLRRVNSEQQLTFFNNVTFTLVGTVTPLCFEEDKVYYYEKHSFIFIIILK